MRITRHARKRLKQRAGVNKKNCQNAVTQAVKYGLSFQDVTGELRRYLEGLATYHNRNVEETRVFRQKVYICHHGALITVLNLPYSYHKLAQRLIAKKRAKFQDS